MRPTFEHLIIALTAEDREDLKKLSLSRRVEGAKGHLNLSQASNQSEHSSEKYQDREVFCICTYQ